jgi:NADPH2:quinone reductase
MGPFLRSGTLGLPIDRVFRFDELDQAFERMRTNRHFGKIIVAMD